MPPQLAVSARRAPDGTPVLSVAGEIDLLSCPELAQAVSRSITERGVDRLVLDLTETSFIDSSSLGVLIGAHRKLAQRGGGLVVVCPRGPMAKTFAITGLDGLFTMAGTVEQATAGQ
jgi:anti-sigma B factor antagonist